MKTVKPFLAATLLALLSSQVVLAETEQEEIESGKQIFMSTCFACHGADGKGVLPGTPNLTGKKSPLLQDSSVLVERITNGYQSKGSPMAMPPKGGNPNLTEVDVKAVVAYMKSTFIGADKKKKLR